MRVGNRDKWADRKWATTPARREQMQDDKTCPTCGNLWPDFCSCPDRDDEVAARDEANRDD